MGDGITALGFSTFGGGPSNPIPSDCHISGFWGCIALAFVTSLRENSISPAGIKVINLPAANE